MATPASLLGPGNSTSYLMGNAGCPCIDASGILATVEKLCVMPKAEGLPERNGVPLPPSGACVPFSYGTGCARHDLLHSPACAPSPAPDYCFRPFCYVDAATCKQSPERVRRSDLFPELDLHFSYSTCNSSANDWITNVKENFFEGVPLSVTIPSYHPPLMYKRNSDGDFLDLESEGLEYYNTSVPFEGVLIDYLDELMVISKGDLDFNYMPVSNGGRRMHPLSKYTAAVQDVEDGLADAAVGDFWITGQRLQMTSYTVPLFYDDIVLVLKNPGEGTDLGARAKRVLEPLTWDMWACIIAVIIFIALISAWFSDHWRKLRQGQFPQNTRFPYAKLAADEFLQKGTYFFNASVEQERAEHLAQKLLMFGFGFFILITVSSYVANLAAFLTRPVVTVPTVKDVIEQGKRLCAHPVIKVDLETKWPDAKFIYDESGSGYPGMLKDYDLGKCDAIVASVNDVAWDQSTRQSYCDKTRDLVFTDTIFLEKAYAFPIKPEYASGLSYWIYQGETFHDITLKNAIEKYENENDLEPFCSIPSSVKEVETDDYRQISPVNLSLPILIFLATSILAIFMHIVHLRNMKQERMPHMPALGDTAATEPVALGKTVATEPVQKAEEGEESYQEFLQIAYSPKVPVIPPSY